MLWSLHKNSRQRCSQVTLATSSQDHVQRHTHVEAAAFYLLEMLERQGEEKKKQQPKNACGFLQWQDALQP